MSAAPAPSGPRETLGRSIIVLLALAVFLNYADRGNLATAAPLMKVELKLSNTQMGVLLSAFFWSYTPGQPLAGWLSEKLDPYRTLALGLFVWTLAMIGTGLVAGFGLLLGLRLLLGLGESAFFPASSKLLARYLPRSALGGANGLIGAAQALGPAFGTFLGGLLVAWAGWRASFLVFGVVSSLWLIPWMLTTRVSRRPIAEAQASAPPSFAEIFRRRAAWGAWLGHFAANYVTYFVMTWLPSYLVKVHGLSIAEMAKVGGLIYLIYAVTALLAGWVADAWMRAGASDTRVRKTFLIAGHVGEAACMLTCAVAGPGPSIVALLLTGVFFGFGAPNHFSVGQTLAGPDAGGKWIGLQNGFANIAGIVAPIVTGIVVDRTGSFDCAFAVAGVVAAAGIIGWAFVIDRIEPIAWAPRAA